VAVSAGVNPVRFFAKLDLLNIIPMLMVMEHFELSKLQSIILTDLSQFIERKYAVDSELVAIFQLCVHDEVERIKFSFVNSTAALEKKRALEGFVQFHEHAIIRLAGCLTRYVPPTKIHRPSRTDTAILCHHLYVGLQDLLSFIAQHYSRYFDREAWIPESYHAIVITEFTKSITPLRHALLSKGFSEALVSHALSPYEEFVNERSSKYHRVIYLKQLKHELLNLARQQLPGKSDDVPLMWTLFDMNFNSVTYYEYLTERIRAYHETTDDFSERIGALTLAIKLMQQRIPKQGYAFDPESLSIRDQLIQWSQLELNYYLQKVSNSSKTIEASANQTDVRVKLDLSVAQLAYFIRLFIEEGLLDQNNITPLIRKIAGVFETKRSDTISAKSLENRYYNVELGTRQSTRTILTNMIRRIDEG
jgi:hypothetical protein